MTSVAAAAQGDLQAGAWLQGDQTTWFVWDFQVLVLKAPVLGIVAPKL